MDIAEILLDLESSLLRADFRHDGRLVGDLLAEEFVEFGSSGKVYSKSQIVSQLEAEVSEPITMSEFVCKEIDEDAALVTYRTRKGEGLSGVEALRSSVWVFRAGRWQMLFHQGTKVQETQVAD